MSDGPVPLTPLEPWIAAKTGSAGGLLSLDALRRYQLAALNDTLSLVRRRSAYYRRRLGEAAGPLGCLEELAELPLTTADDLRATPLEFVCVSHTEVERIVTLPTSGTTGPAKRIFFTAADQELTRDFFHRGMSTMVEVGDRVLILLPGDLPGSVGDLLRDGLARMEVEGIPHGPVKDVRHTLAVMADVRATVLVGIPVQVYSLAMTAAAGGGRLYPGPRSVLLSTDRAPHAVVRAIETAWGCEVYDHYGTTEMGLGGGVDCRARVGYHLREADLLFEIVDPTTGRPVPDGMAGEVVFTTLSRAAMPLVRYRTGDVSRFITEPCPCGSVLRRMAHVDERLAGVVRLGGGEILKQADLDEALFPVEGLADFKVLFAEKAGQATMVVRVRSLDAARPPDRNQMLRSLERIPALATLMARGRVSIELRDWPAGEGTATGTAKRTIERCRRSEHELGDG